MIRVMIADACAVIREGLKRIFSGTADIQAAGEAEGRLEAFRLAVDGNWDVVLWDVSMPGVGSEFDFIKELKRERPNLPILVFSSHPEHRYGLQALRSGASGYIKKEVAFGELLHAIRRVANGGKYISQSLAESMAQHWDKRYDRLAHEALSQREFEVLLNVATGKTPSEIARGMSLSVKTISTYRSRILEKLDLKTTADLIHYAVQNDLIPSLYVR